MQQANPTGSLWLHSAIPLSLYQNWKADWWGILECQIQATDANMQCILSLTRTWYSQGCHLEPRPLEKNQKIKVTSAGNTYSKTSLAFQVHPHFHPSDATKHNQSNHPVLLSQTHICLYSSSISSLSLPYNCVALWQYCHCYEQFLSSVPHLQDLTSKTCQGLLRLNFWPTCNCSLI